MSRVEYFEEYRCGCVSDLVTRRKDLLGYCQKHGESRKYVHRIAPPRTPTKGTEE